MEITSSKKNIFCYCLMLATVCPILLILIYGDNLNLSSISLGSILAFIGIVHVPSTLALYVDSKFKLIIAHDTFKYLYAPVMFIIGFGIIFCLSSQTFQGILYCIYWLWQTWHYGRQNIGVNSFISISFDNKSPHIMEKQIITLSTVAGMLGILHVLSHGVLPEEYDTYTRLFYHLGFFLFVITLILSLIHIVSNKQEASIISNLAFMICVAFFSPMYFSHGINSMFLSYAIAHGYQYLIFMSVISVSHVKRHVLSNKIIVISFMIISTMIIGWILGRPLEWKNELEGSQFLKTFNEFLIGCSLAFVICHFIIDSWVWRLSRKESRDFILDRFSFVFK